MVRDKAAIKVGGKVMAELAKGTEFRVTSVNGTWVGGAVTVDDKQVNGWVAGGDVMVKGAETRREPATKPAEVPKPDDAAWQAIIGQWRSEPTDTQPVEYRVRFDNDGTAALTLPNQPRLPPMTYTVAPAAITLKHPATGKKMVLDILERKADAMVLRVEGVVVAFQHATVKRRMTMVGGTFYGACTA